MVNAKGRERAQVGSPSKVRCWPASGRSRADVFEPKRVFAAMHESGSAHHAAERVSQLCASYSEIHEETGSNPIRSKQFSRKVLLDVQQLARDFISVLCTWDFVRSSKKLAR